MRLPLRLLSAFFLLLAVSLHATIGVDLQMQLGNPSKATADATNQRNYLIKRAQYAIDYNNTTREPNWVSWNVTTADLGSSGRGDFSTDPTLPGTFYQVQTTDYSGSGYDRGHMCPSGDRTATVADNQVTFYMSNMVPQSPDNNQGVWASFENYCRSLAGAGNEIQIITGPGGFTATTLASGVAVPGYVWKIALVIPLGPGSALSRITGTTRVIALKIPNIAGIRSNPWQQYITSIAQLETDTGYTFLTDLPQATAAALRTKLDDQSGTGTPRITTQPATQAAALGGSATFTVAATGDAPLNYQWSLDGDDIAGATAATLTLANIKVANLGSYSVVVGNAAGTVTSSAAALVLGAADSGVLYWDFSAATPTNGLPPEITGGALIQGSNNGTTQVLTSVSVASGYAGVSGGNNAGAAARVGPLNRTAGTGSAYFEFTLGAAAGRQLVVSSFTFGNRSTATGPQAFALYTSLDNFTNPIAAGPLANNSVWTLIAPTFPAFAGIPGTALTFRLYAYNGVGNAGVSTANWRIDDLRVGVSVVANSATPPIFIRQPGPATVVAGGTVTLSAAAGGTPAPAYQWRKDGIALPGATAATLTLSGVTAAQAGSYSVVVSNSAASSVSTIAGLAVIRRSYAGYYFGTLSGSGAFALQIAADNTGVFLGYAPPAAYFSRAVSVDDFGRFRIIATTTPGLATAPITAAAAETPPRAAAVDDRTLEGTLAESGTLTGAALSGSALTLSGTRADDRGSAAAFAGFYQANQAGTAQQTLAIISPTGQGLVVAKAGPVLTGGTGTLDAAGRLTVVTPAQQTIVATISAATGAIDARIGALGFTGFAEGSAALAPQRLVNLSTRASAGVDEQVAIVGFVIAGLESKTVLIRAIGPALRAFGVPTALAAPRLELMSGSTSLATNAGWSTAANAAEVAAAATRTGAFPLAAGSADSVILTTLLPGTYTAVVSAADGRAGAALVEVYDVSGGGMAQKLSNLSARAATGAGDNTLIAGLVVGGTTPKRVLLRAAGPALAAFGVSGVLLRPELTLYAGTNALAANAGWSTSADALAIAEAAARTGAFAFGATSLDAALVINLAPGAYTAQVNGLGGTAGIVLLEVYEVP